jgi:hypothetical protein
VNLHGTRETTRALSGATAAIVLALIVVVSGAATYVAFSRLGQTTRTLVSCAPATSPVCLARADLHDVQLVVPIRTAQQGTPLPFTATLPTGELPSQFSFNFGDGTPPVTSTAPVVDHAFASPGTYLVWVGATVGGVVHDNDHALALVRVTPSFASNSLGELPQVAATVVNNSSSASQPLAVLSVGESVTLAGSYSVAPTNPAWVTAPPKILAPGGTVQPLSSSGSSASARVIYNNPGEYTVTFAGSALGPGGANATADYLWSVFVAPNGVHAGTGNLARPHSPHPGTIVAYEVAPGGGYSEDPAIDYDIYADEVILNVYESLIFYNGTQTGPASSAYVPELATCVPGGSECRSLYGQSLVSGWNYTFVLSPVASFYDPYTGRSWPVYPSDVVFSLARTMSFADQPCPACNNGWIVTQALVPAGDGGWDGALHYPYNNTPSNVFASMSVNDSRWCPSVALTQAHGCVTFHVHGGNRAWPYFLELISDGQGGSIVPCGWFSSSASTGGQTGLPYWTQGNVSDAGDHPCLLPGGATSTNSSAFQTAVNAIPLTGWDNYQYVCSGAATGTFCGQVQYRMAGTGPYYLSGYTVGTSYQLKANPTYKQNPTCTTGACLPAPGAYPGTVDVQWANDASVGEEALASGVADFATIPSTDFALMLEFAEQNRINVLSIPSIVINVGWMALNFSVANAGKYTSTPITVPGDWFSYLGMREFFARAYPYATVQATVNTKDGIETAFSFGGAIPQFMADYYPTNISWPSGDPCTNTADPACATYWWNQMTNVTNGPYFDPEAARCTTAAPCTLPLFGALGSPDVDQRFQLWSGEISTLSGGRVKTVLTDLNSGDLYTGTSLPPGTTFMTVSVQTWAPDFPDPADYVLPFYFPDSTFTYGSALAEQFALPAFNASGCHSATDYAYWANAANPLPQTCQGAAYWAMVTAFTTAGPLPDGPQRVLTYNLGEQIANRLALYTYLYQKVQIVPLSSWIDPASYDASVLVGGGEITDWFYLSES